MADEIVTRQQLVDAGLDAESLQTFISGSDIEDVLTRLGKIYPTLAKLVRMLMETGGWKAYETEAILLATTPLVNPSVGYAFDTKKLYLWNGTIWKDEGLSPLDLARAYADANPMFKEIKIVSGMNTHNFTTPGRYVLEAALPVGQLTNWPQDSAGYHMPGEIFSHGITVGGAGAKLPTLEYFPYINAFEKKTLRPTNSSGAMEATWSTFSTYEKLLTIFTTKTELSTSISDSLSNVSQDTYFGKKFSTAEMNATNLYTGGYYVGYNSINGTKAVSFNSVKGRMFNTAGGECQWRIFTGSDVSTGSFGYTVLAANQANYTYSGTCTLPTSDTGEAQSISLGQVVNIPANTPFVIVFRKTALDRITIAHVTAVTGNIENRGFNLLASAVEWGTSTIANGSTPNFTQSGFQLLFELKSSSVGPSPVAYTPTLVVPSKYYALEGLESHIYPEHLLAEDYKLYDFDLTCTKGKQSNRGFVWTPSSAAPQNDVAGTYPLTIAANDKQKGTQLSSATSSVILADKNAKNGQTVKVAFIADSLGAAGTITQRLLDIDATDVMNVSLIGTRGTAPNKHEGRGGYTINDYTTVGRTYYRFTVSGVVTPPALNAAIYAFGGSKFLVQEVALTGGSGTITCSLYSGSAPTNGASGTLTKDNSAEGDATIAFSNVQSQSGNPFWNPSANGGNGAVDYPNYLSVNSLSAPDYALIQLCINDVFSLTTDNDVKALAATSLPKLDTLITSIKAANSSVKIGICQPPIGADQDAFGENYFNGQTSRRFKRNMVVFIDELRKYYNTTAKEGQNIYFVPCGANVDTENNYPTKSQQINSHNTTMITIQSNAVHPADSGYKQIGDAIYAFLKAV